MQGDDVAHQMPTNTLAFALAIIVIIFVLPGRPYTVPLHLSLISLSYSCLIAMHFVSEENIRTADVSFFLAWTLLAIAAVVKLAYYLLMKGFLWEMWWAPRYHVQARNLAECCQGGVPDQKEMTLMSKFRKQYRLTVTSLNEKGLAS